MSFNPAIIARADNAKNATKSAATQAAIVSPPVVVSTLSAPKKVLVDALPDRTCG